MASIKSATHRASTAPPRRSVQPKLTALACACVSACAQAQGAQRVEPITVIARSAPVLDVDQVDVGGFASSLSKTPQSISVFGSDLLAANATQTLSNLLKLDASLADNYNAAGYLESLSLRGFNLDQANNFRRNGLATSNYAPIALENKDRIEVLKGVAGLQSGVSTPGGLVNYVTKKPLQDSFALMSLSGDSFGDGKLAVDANHRFGKTGVRVNVASERLRSAFDGTNGSRHFASAALAVPISAATSFAIEFEHHHKSQPSVPGLGLLDRDGDGIAETLPPLDRRLQRLNLNDQPWSLPVVSRTTQGSVTLNHRFNERWKANFALGRFASRLDDRIAFPDGCGTAANYVYPGLCGNGDVDIYDFRSENERRTIGSWQATLHGRFAALRATHHLRLSADGRSARTSLPPKSAYNYAGSTNLFAPIAVPANAALESINSNQRERATEFSLSLRSQWAAPLQSFAGVRSARVSRASVRSDGSEATAFTQTVTTPWIGVSSDVTTATTIYASYGKGAELENVPNRPTSFSNFGSVLTGLKSTQLEIGMKWQAKPRLLLTATAFEIEKPFADDVTDASGMRTRIAGGKLARHRGVELSAVGRASELLSIQASASYLDARYTRAIAPSQVGRRVVNVPQWSASLFADYKIAAIDGLSVNALVWSQHGKPATASGAVTLPTAWQIDIGASYRARFAAQALTLRMNIENATDRVYWREAPTTSWGGSYLFASAPRTFKLGATLEF
jgi:iron complex outermembrane recepter protein